MPHLLLVGHWKVLKTKTNKSWNTHEFRRVCTRTRNIPNLTAVESCLCPHKTVRIVIYGQLWTPPDKEPRFSLTQWLDFCPSLDSTENEHSKTPKFVTSDTLRKMYPRYAHCLLFISHLPHAEWCTCAVSHEMGSSDFSHLYSFTLIICGINILCSNGKATSGKVTLASWVHKMMAVLVFYLFNLIWNKQKFQKTTRFLLWLSFSVIILACLSLSNWVKEQRDW